MNQSENQWAVDNDYRRNVKVRLFGVLEKVQFVIGAYDGDGIALQVILADKFRKR